MRILLIVFIFIGLIYLLLGTKKRENFDDYSDFYKMMTNPSLELEDKCRFAKIKIDDANDGIKVSSAILQAANDFIENQCSGKREVKKSILEKDNLLDIDPKEKDSLSNVFKKYCQPKFGSLKDRVNFDNYTIVTDEDGAYTLNGVRADKLEIDEATCRRLEEYVKNEQKSKQNPNAETIDSLHKKCLVDYGEILVEAGINDLGYNYYLSRDGKYYLNDEPLERVSICKKNCQIIQDIIDKQSSETKKDDNGNRLNQIDTQKKANLCKRSLELDYICSVYDKDKVLKYGKNRDLEPILYRVSTGPNEEDDFEYSYLTPEEYPYVTKNLQKGKSGLKVDQEIDLCYRKMMFDRQCNSIDAAKNSF